MANWTPPKFTFFKQPDGELLAIDDQGAPLACQPTLTTKDVNGVETVVDPWGNTVTEYQLPPYTIHVDYAPDGQSLPVGVAVDADGVPLPLVPTLRVTGTFFASNEVGVVLPDGSEARLPPYQGPDKFYIHVASSGTRQEAGTPEFEYVAVDGNGVPLPVQPTMVGDVTNPTDPSSVQVSWFSGSATPEPFEFPEFSVHLQYDPAADRGAAAAKPVPIAMGSDGKPLAIQPDFEIDPTDPSAVIAILPDGQKYDPATYEFPKYHVQLQYPAGTYHAAAAPVPTPIAVDENGVPLPMQPHLEVDPTDHSQVKATSLDGTSTPVEVYHPQKDFYVHIEGSGSEHGAPQFAAVAVDANGVPLPIQPHLEVDPTDPTKVTAVLPDGTSYEPPNIYPPAGEPPEEWPPPPSDETTEEDDAAETDEEATDSEDAATADEEGPESFEADKSYAGVEHEEGPVAQDEDWNEGEAAGTAEEGLLTAGLDSSPADARAEAVRTDEESGLARTEQTEPPETDELPVAEPVELLVEGLTPAGDEEITATPITLPGQARDDEEITATPITLPGQARDDEEITATPITLPGQARDDEEITATPITLPGQARDDEEITATPITLPGQARDDEEITATPITLPGQARDDEEITATPITLPGQARDDEEIEELEPLEDAGIPSVMDAVPPMAESGLRATPGPRAEADEDLVIPAEEVEVVALDMLGEATDPIEMGLEPVEIQEIEFELPSDRYEQSEEEEVPEEEEEQQP